MPGLRSISGPHLGICAPGAVLGIPVHLPGARAASSAVPRVSYSPLHVQHELPVTEAWLSRDTPVGDGEAARGLLHGWLGWCAEICRLLLQLPLIRIGRGREAGV